MASNNHLNKGLAAVYFLFNTAAWPPPVTFTVLLGPIRAVQVWQRFQKLIVAFGVLFVAYAGIHLWEGVVLADYVKSSVFFVLLIFSGLAAFDYLASSRMLTKKVWEWVVYLSIGLFAIAALAWFSPWFDLFWTNHKFIAEGAVLPRYKGLGYEPSHYAMAMSPVALYFFWKLVLTKNWKPLLLLVAVLVPIALTLSFGFAAGFGLAIIITLIVVMLRYRRFERLLIVPAAAGLLMAAGVMLFPNPIANRVHHIFSGNDTSVNGRTTEAFMLAHHCAAQASLVYGVGLGQVKHVGETVIRPYYQNLDPEGYSKENWPVLRIPNALAETLASFGYLGLLLKLGFLFYCFARFKVYDNYFNLSVFLFTLVYQAMGSFIFSSTEIIMWAMAFAKIHDDFDVLKPQRLWG